MKILNLYVGIGGNRKLQDELLDLLLSKQFSREDIIIVEQGNRSLTVKDTGRSDSSSEGVKLLICV